MSKNKENNYNLCYEGLCKEFAKCDPEEMAEKSGAKYDPEKRQFTLTYFNREYLISYPQGSIILKDESKNNLSSEDNDKFFDKILIISYLHRCTKSILTNKWVPYRELEGVGASYDTFAIQGINKLIQFFGDKGELFLKAGIKLGGKKITFGDVGIEISVLPNVPIAMVLWLADEELEATANILYDYSATKELHIEDLAGLCSIAAEELIRTAKEISK